MQFGAETMFNILETGAVADGITDNTEAIQAALDAAGRVGGCVLVPPGRYACGRISVPPGITLMGFRGWGYRETGGSVLVLRDANAKCLIDMTGAHGSMVKDLQLLGNHLSGDHVHGIGVFWPDYDSRENADPAREDNSLPEETHIGFREDSFVIDGCQIKNFSGDAIHMENIFAFTVCNSMLIANQGNAIYMTGWDGWIHNCIIHTNHGAAIYGDRAFASVTINGNRIEWNRNGGIHLHSCNALNIVGNYFDRAYGPAIQISGREAESANVTITGNIFHRSGKYRPSFAQDAYENSHIYLNRCRNFVVSANTFSVGKDDKGQGIYTPDYGIVYRALNSCALTDNVLSQGAVKQCLVDLGEHTGEIRVCGNMGEIQKIEA